MTRKAFNRTLCIIVLTYIFYKLQVAVLVAVIHTLLLYWNIYIYHITTLKENHPALYIVLPFILVYLLLWREKDAGI